MKDRIELGAYENSSPISMPGWDIMMALQFENLVLHNRRAIQQLLGLPSAEIIWDNPYFQRATKTQLGCQIDYLIQSAHHFLYVCEIKFSRRPISVEIIAEMQEKMNRLKLPKYMSQLPVLIHVNGVQNEVAESRFFAKIIDFSHLLTTHV